MYNNKQRILLTRKELYELVWSKSISKLAVEFEVSDVGLAKACRRHDIPIPPRGYWAKKKFGKKVAQQPPLPTTRPEDEQITITGGPSKTSKLSPELARKLPKPLDTNISYKVPNELIEPHPLIEKTSSILRTAREKDGFIALDSH